MTIGDGHDGGRPGDPGPQPRDRPSRTARGPSHPSGCGVVPIATATGCLRMSRRILHRGPGAAASVRSRRRSLRVGRSSPFHLDGVLQRHDGPCTVVTWPSSSGPEHRCHQRDGSVVHVVEDEQCAVVGGEPIESAFEQIQVGRPVFEAIPGPSASRSMAPGTHETEASRTRWRRRPRRAFRQVLTRMRPNQASKRSTSRKRSQVPPGLHECLLRRVAGVRFVPQDRHGRSKCVLGMPGDQELECCAIARLCTDDEVDVERSRVSSLPE